MKDILNSYLAQIKLMDDTPESCVLIRQSIVALNRIALQHACIVVVEWIVNSDLFQNYNEKYDIPINELMSPTDGTLLSSLSELLVFAENLGWNGVSRPFFEQLTTSRPCIRMIKSGKFTVENVFNSFVTTRNDGVEGHGIPGEYDSESEIDSIQLFIEKMEHILPVVIENKKFVVPFQNNLEIKTLRLKDGNLICYRSIKRIADGKCLVVAQEQKSLFERSSYRYEVEDVFCHRQSLSQQEYEIRDSYDEEWSPFVLMPDRLTSEFTGRDSLLNELADWADDMESRACLVYGDGGMGKTTLVVEFLHRIVDGTIKLDWRPEIITFYTAKKTRWGIDGLEIIQARDVGISDVALYMIRAYEMKSLGSEWYRKQPEALIQKAASYFQEQGIDKSSHLIIIDNTETMTTNDDDAKHLAKQIREIFRKVGRTIVTSRRREAIEARQIEVPPLSQDESIQFLKRRGKALNRVQVNQAGDATLRKYSDSLGRKPLVLEVFIQTLEDKGLSIQKAFDRVLRMQRQDLGEFLYSDAWGRFSNDMRMLLILMTRVSDVHDETLLKLCCMQAKTSIISAIDALEESRGIASLSRVSGTLQIVFNSEFMLFCKDRTVAVNGIDLPSDKDVTTVHRRYTQFLKSIKRKVYDRVSLAYRHALARAAYTAYQEERFDDCELFYEEAVVKDSSNGYLFDRYAYFLYRLRRYDDALVKSKRATQLLSSDPETWFTRGMVEARIGATKAALISLSKAESNGKMKHLCLLQKAYAYLNDTPPDTARARNCLTESEKAIDRTDPYYWKHVGELRRVQSRI